MLKQIKKGLYNLVKSIEQAHLENARQTIEKFESRNMPDYNTYSIKNLRGITKEDTLRNIFRAYNLI